MIAPRMTDFSLRILAFLTLIALGLQGHSADRIPITGHDSPGMESVDGAMMAIMRKTKYGSATIAISRNGKLVMS